MFKLLEYGVKRITDGAFIPPNASNRDWREYENWLKEGNIPLPADPILPPEKSRFELVILSLLEKKIITEEDIKNAKTLQESKKEN